MKIDHVTMQAVTNFFQESTTYIGSTLGLEPVDRIVMLEIVHARMQTGRRRGPTVATVSRGVGLPYNTARRRVQGLIDKGLVTDTKEGLDAADWPRIFRAYEDICTLLFKRMEPVVLRMRSIEDSQFGKEDRQNGNRPPFSSRSTPP